VAAVRATKLPFEGAVQRVSVLERNDAARSERLVFEPVGDRCYRKVRCGNVRDIIAHQRGVRIDLKGDGNQRKYKDGGQGSHRGIVVRD
jgi:hypothetical protein